MNGIETLKKKYYHVMGLTLIVSVLAAILIAAFSGIHVVKVSVVTLSAVALFFVYHAIVAKYFYFKALNHEAEAVARFYMVHLLIKFIVAAVIAFVGSIVLGVPYNKIFVITFALVFFLTLIAESYAFVQIEKKKRLNETIQ